MVALPHLGAGLRVEIARSSAETKAGQRTLFLGLAGLQMSGANPQRSGRPVPSVRLRQVVEQAGGRELDRDWQGAVNDSSPATAATSS